VSGCGCEHPLVRHAEGELLGHPGKHPCTVFGCGCTDCRPLGDDAQVHLPHLIAREFGISTSEARRLQATGGVTIDGVVPLNFDYDLKQLEGKTLTVGSKRSVEL
jgi:hypothetical protein